MAQPQKYYFRQASFAGGLYSSNLWARDDLKRYAIGAKEMLNFYPYSYGGFTRRQGTEFVWECKNTTAKRLIPFHVGSFTQYVIEVGDKYFRFYRNGGIILNSDGTPYEIETSYTADQIQYLKTVQAADRMYICHYDVPIKVLSRYGDTNWTLTNYTSKRGPFLDQNTTDITITPSAKSGTITLTASNNLFTANDVGRQVKISYNMPSQSFTWGYEGKTAETTSPSYPCGEGWSFQCADPWTCVVTIQQSDDNGATWFEVNTYNLNEDYTANFSASGTVDHPCLIRIHFSKGTDGYGSSVFTVDPFISDSYLTITKYTNAKTVTATVYKDKNEYIFALPKTEATSYFSMGAWYIGNYPRTAGFYQDRLFFGSTEANPLTIWGSQTGNYDDFGVHQTPEDSDGVSFSLVSNQINVTWSFISLNVLLAFTAASEWKITAGASGTAITPSNIYAVQQSTEGCWDGLDPVIIGNRALFVTSNDRHIRDIAYDYSTDSFRGNDLTLYNRDLFDKCGIIAWAYQADPDNVLWVINENGELLSFTYIQEQDVQAWAHHETDGKFISCACARNTTLFEGVAMGEQTYFIVERVINGVTKRYVETITARAPDINLPIYSDSCLTYQGDATHTVSGLSHLEGKEVCVVADGGYCGLYTVTNGKVDFEIDATSVVVGLPYTSTFETLDISIPRQDGTSFARFKKVDEVTIRLKDTYGGFVGINTTDLDMMEAVDMNVPQDIGGSSTLYNTAYKTEPQGGYDSEAHISIIQNEPYPMTILSIVAGVTMG